MNPRICLVALVVVFAFLISSPAPILDIKDLVIDFTNPQDAKEKAEWSDPDELTIKPIGLGREGDEHAVRATVFRENWIQTKPLAVGLYWRAPTGASVEVKILPLLKKDLPADVFVRFSADYKHWSSWQALRRDEKNTKVAVFKGQLGIPQRELTKYQSYLEQYQKLDVPWASDEEAVCKWILNQQPDFFEHALPLIGYIEFLFDAPFYEGWRIKRFEAQISYGMSGLSSPPKDRNIDVDVPPHGNTWRFKAP